MRLELMRRHQKWLLWILVILTLIVFGLFGTFGAISDLLGRQGRTIAGYYRGQEVPQNEFLQFRMRWGQFMGRSDDYQPRDFWGDYVRLREAQRSGIQVPDAELIAALRDRIRPVRQQMMKETGSMLPENVTEDSFDKEAYDKLLKFLRMPAAQYELALREILMVQKYDAALLSFIRISEPESRLAFDKFSLRLRARYVAFRAQEFSEMEQPAEDDVRRYFEENSMGRAYSEATGDASAGRYHQPDRVAIEYLYEPYEKHMAQASVAYEEVRSEYLRNRNRYRRNPEDKAGETMPYRELKEVYSDIEKELRKEKAKGESRNRLRQAHHRWIDRMERGGDKMTDETLDAMLATLGKELSLPHVPQTPMFAEKELDKAGRIRASRENLIKQAFWVFRKEESGKETRNTEKARTTLSEIIEGTDECYILRIVKKKPGYTPSWSELRNGTVVDLTVAKVQEDYKGVLGFRKAQEEARRWKGLLYQKTLGHLAKELSVEVESKEISRSGDAGSAGAADRAVLDAGFKTPVGETSMPMDLGDGVGLLFVADGTESKRTLAVLRADRPELRSHVPDPSKEMLELFYDQVKTRKKYQQPGQVRVEYLLARTKKFVDEIQPTEEDVKAYHEQHAAAYADDAGKPQPLDKVADRVRADVQRTRGEEKARQALESALKEEFMKPPAAGETRPPKTEREKSDERDKIKDLAEKNGLDYVRNLNEFLPRNEDARAEVLGEVGRTEGIETLLADTAVDSWSAIQACYSGPFSIRVIDRDAPTPAPFDEEIQRRLKEDYVSGWESLDPRSQLFALWEQQLLQTAERIADMPPVPIKVRREFHTQESDYLVEGTAPGHLEDKPALAAALAKLKPGELSDVITEGELSFLALATAEREVRKVKAHTGQVRQALFAVPPDSASDKDVEAYFESHRADFRGAPEVEVEYVLADMEERRAKTAAGLDDAALKTFHRERKESLYARQEFDEAKSQVRYDLSLEKAIESARTDLQAVLDAAKKTRGETGPDLAALAQKHQLTCTKVSYSMDQASRLTHLGSATGIPAGAFRMRDGEISPIHSCPSSMFFLRRLRAVAPVEPVLQDVRDRVIAALLSERARAAAQEWVKTILGKAKTASLKQAIASVPVPQGKETPVVTESGFLTAGETPADAEGLPAKLREEIVKSQTGDVLGPLADEGDALWFAKVGEVKTERQVKALYSTYASSAFMSPQAAIPDEELREVYEKEKESFRVADGVRVEYLSARFPDLANSEGIKAKATDEVLRAIYEAGKESKYRSPATPGSDTPSYIPFEKVKDEISFAFRDGEAVKLADERIRQAQEKLQRSASPAAVDLEALAKELGLRYGLTDYILKDGVKNAEATLKDLQGVTEMPGIAFGMKDGAVLADDRLKVMNGRALIRRKDLRPSFIRDFADVRGEVQTRVAARKATDLAAQHARQVREKALAGFAEGADAQARSKTFESVVQEMPYVGDSQFSPAARNTEYFMRPFLMGRGGPGQYWAYVPGLNRPGVNFPNFAFEAFELPRGRISAPVAEPQDETECYLLIISGTTQPTEEEYKKQKEQLAAGYLRQKQTAAVQGVSAALERLTDPPR